MNEPEVAEDLAEIAAEYAEIEADEKDDQGEDAEDAPPVKYLRRRSLRGAAVPR